MPHLFLKFPDRQITGIEAHVRAIEENGARSTQINAESRVPKTRFGAPDIQIHPEMKSDVRIRSAPDC